MIKVIIFDLDGLLINSQPFQYKAYNEVFTKYGFPLTKEEWIEYWIQKSMSCKNWVKLKNIPHNFKKLRQEKKEIYEKLIVSDLELKPGANQAINTLLKKYDLCIASASLKSSIMVVLKKFNLESKFKKIISDQEAQIENAKPFPDVFLYVAKEMGVKPEECVVIEDSKAGLKATKSANMRCIICPDTFCKIGKLEYSEADIIIDSLDEVDLDTINNLN